MGKRRPVKRFIDANRVQLKVNEDKVAPINLEKVIEEKIEEVQPKEKKVSFQLRCELPSENERKQNAASTDFNDLSRYDVHFKDDYDYMKHLKARDDTIWQDEGTDLCIAPKPDLQKKKKKLRAEKKLKKQQNLGLQLPPDNYEHMNVYVDDLPEHLVNKLFVDAEVIDNFPDDILDILDGDASADEFGEEGAEDGEEGAEEWIDNNFMKDGEVDYSKMPPLEEFEPASREDGHSDMSDYMDVSDEEYEDEDSDDDSDDDSDAEHLLEMNDENFPSLQGAKSTSVKAPKKMQVAKDFITDADEKKPALVMSLQEFRQMPQGDLDRFFDGVADASDDEGGYQDADAECPQSGLPSSRTAAKRITENVDMLNDHFNAMLVRDYKRSDLCGEGLEEVEGALDEDAPQFRAAAAADRSGRPLDGRVHLSGPFAGPETSVDKELRDKALNFCKNWRETKEELVEVAVPDRRAMMYNATNLPVVRNKNLPALIKPDLPLYFNQKKKKGLTVKDIKAHDREMNAPKSNADDDAQTFKTMLTELSYRPPDESSADRRERKTAIKELRRGRREEKKLNQLAHREMLIQTNKVLMHARHYRNTAVI